jgi:pimeloyl-ACP methyl ester carboxylesterase
LSQSTNQHSGGIVSLANNSGIKLYWQWRGDGEPVLLIMGLGYTSEMWHRVSPELSSGYQVITFDNRGVGQSDQPPGPYPISTMADDAAAVLDAAGVDSAHVFGISMGGMIAQELMLRHSRRVRSLILGCTHCGGAEASPPAAEVLRVLEARATMSPEDGVRAMVPYIYDSATPRSRVEEDLAIRLRTFPKAESYLAQLAGIMAWGSHPRLAAIDVPTLIIHGLNDQLVPPQNARTLARAIPASRLLMIESASHIFTTDQPGASLEAVSSFLGEVSARGRGTTGR